jgi:anti-anti-sigma factor
MDELDIDESNLTIEQTTDAAGHPMITLAGELDVSNAEALRRAVERVISSHPSRLVFELSDLTFMDSSGIAVMVLAANSVPAVEFRHPSTIVRRVVEATGLTDVLRLDPS